MNIFYLHDSPAIAASLHCDQHIHKMILETAQLLSTAMHIRFPTFPAYASISPMLYKPAYVAHPCAIWARQTNGNMLWLCELALSLQSERESVANCGEHASIPVIRIVQEFIHTINPYSSFNNDHTPHVFCGPATISHRIGMSTIQRYKEFYRRKAQRWPLDSGIHMSYKGRPVPDFLQDLIPPSTPVR